MKVDFSIDESDMLLVSALDLETGAEQAISIADIGRGASDESGEELARKAALLASRLEELRRASSLERGLEAELDEIEGTLSQGGRLGDAGRLSKGALRMLKAELEGLVGELLARRAEARADRAAAIASAGGTRRGSRP